ncbi:MAG: hypothetical protein A2036_03905 [Omnitrophica bacterium GWA2_50_21]|nr:MAG: hypothetical protein A2036_03905 [Omnitrophica bacterium GWA2_50_21]
MKKFRAADCWLFSILLSPVWGIIYAMVTVDRWTVVKPTWKMGNPPELLSEVKTSEGRLHAGSVLLLLVLGAIAFFVWGLIVQFLLGCLHGAGLL